MSTTYRFFQRMSKKIIYFISRLTGHIKHQPVLSFLLYFFFAIAIFTVLSRGTSGVIAPKITIAYPSAGIVSQAFQAMGYIEHGLGESIYSPQGLLVDKLFVDEGENVEQGTEIACFNIDEIDNLLTLKKAQLQKLNVQIAQLRKGKSADAYNISNAQSELDAAYSALTKTTEAWNLAITKATQENANAKARLDALLSDPASDEAEIESVAQEVKVTQNNLENTIIQKEAAIASATDVAQQTENNRNKALHDFQIQEEQIADNNAVNNADAQIMQTQIDVLSQETAVLEEFRKNNGLLISPKNGVITSLNLTQGKTSPVLACTVANNDNGYKVRFDIPASEPFQISVSTEVQVEQNNVKASFLPSSIRTNMDGSVSIAGYLQNEGFKIGVASVFVLIKEQKYDLCVPSSAIHLDNGGFFVFIADESNTILGAQNVIRKSYVTVLEHNETLTAIASSVSGKDAVVATTTKPLVEGARVRILR